jgi:hypothetical protein
MSRPLRFGLLGLHVWRRSIAALAVVGVTGASANAAPVQALRVDGTMVQGEWAGCPDASSVNVRTIEGLTKITFDDLARLSFEAQSKPRGGQAVFYLADGGRLYGELVGGATDAVLTRTALGDGIQFSFQTLAGIQLVRGEEFAKAEGLFQSALQTRLTAQDVLITRGPEDATSVRGRLERLDAERGTFAFGERTRAFQADKIYGVVFAVGAAKRAAYPVTVELVDGSVVSGSLERADAERLAVATSVGPTVEMKVVEVVNLRVRSPRVVYLSDLTPTGERTEGMLHRPWPVRKDRSVSARPLSMGGRVFDKGLGVHSRTELDYQLDRGYESLVATIGIDDLVRPAGSVVFRVLGDGKVLFDSAVLTGKDPPRDVNVNVVGVSLLTLVIDYGDELDLSDQADWGGARLLKPAPTGRGKP